MKTIILTFFCFLISQNNKEIFSINNLQNEYKKNENINIKLENFSNKNIIYFISLYRYNSDWREIVSDVQNPYNRIIKYSKIYPTERKKIKISINKAFYFLEKGNFKKYKLAIVYKIENDTTTRCFYSNEFKINTKSK